MTEDEMTLTAGIDLGSTAIKVVLVEGGRMAWHKAVPTAPGQAGIARTLIAEGLAGHRDLEDDIYLDGGAANNRGLVGTVEDELCRDLYVLPQPQFTVAFGAACALV